MIFTADILNNIKLIDILMFATDANNKEKVNQVKYFYQKYSKVEPGVLNAIVILSLRNKRGYIPNLKYLYKTINTWLDNKRDTAYKAAHYLNEYWIYQSNPNNKKSNETKNVIKPDFVNEYLEELKDLEQ